MFCFNLYSTLGDLVMLNVFFKYILNWLELRCSIVDYRYSTVVNLCGCTMVYICHIVVYCFSTVVYTCRAVVYMQDSDLIQLYIQYSGLIQL